jgi:integrase
LRRNSAARWRSFGSFGSRSSEYWRRKAAPIWSSSKPDSARWTSGCHGLHEKGGKEHDVPCHHNLDHFLDEYIAASGIASDANGYLFRTAARKTGLLTEKPMHQQDAYRMIQRRAKAAGIETRIGNHTFRATGITAYLKNSGKLEVAQHIANHESPRTTKLYDRRQDDISLDEIERIAI